MLDKELDTCPFCQAKIKYESNSLHVWEIEYDCGCKIWGGIISSNCDYKIEKKCKYEKV